MSLSCITVIASTRRVRGNLMHNYFSSGNGSFPFWLGQSAQLFVILQNLAEYYVRYSLCSAYRNHLLFFSENNAAMFPS